MKIEKINLEGKKGSVEVKDSIFSSKIKFTSIGLLNTEVCWGS